VITVDRKSSAPVQQQIADQVRYLIARGRFAVGSTLPSTRALAAELGVSFHTIRKAYGQLEREGLVDAVTGHGFVVRPMEDGTDSDRMETGAQVMRIAVQRLIGLGLSDADIDYIFDEQYSTITGDRAGQKVLFVGAYRDQAVECVQQLTRFRMGQLVPCTLEDVDEHADADYACCTFPMYRVVRSRLHRSEVVGVEVSINHEAQSEAARLMQHETLAVVTRYPDAIGPLTREIRVRTAFPGQLLAGSVNEGAEHVEQIISQAHAVLFSPTARPRVAGLIKGRRSTPVQALLTDTSVSELQRVIGRE